VVEIFFLALIVASWLYWIAAWWCTRSFFSAPEREGRFAPPVSVLKPLCGLDPEVYENLVSFCRQDYPDFEILCGVSDPGDPVIPIVQRVQHEYPDTSIRLLVVSTGAANRKAGILHALTSEARHEMLVISDSDIRVAPDYLHRVVAPLADEGIGLVHCPYRSEKALSIAARLEAQHMTCTFLPSVMVAHRLLRGRLAMGATMALRRSDLGQLGGFAAFEDYLADDYQLGLRISGLDRQVQLSHHVVTCVIGATGFREQWQREVRWARTNRANRPREYPGILLTFSTPLSFLLVVASGFEPIGWEALALSVSLRWLVAWSVTGLVGDQACRKWLVWLPLRDMLSCLVWCAGAVERRVVWRGQAYTILPGGRLQCETDRLTAAVERIMAH
jgi:ceramide glucosyltransferase